MRWNHRDADGWNRWFAWYPVDVKDDNDNSVSTVWLETIERRPTRNRSPDEPIYQYRNRVDFTP